MGSCGSLSRDVVRCYNPPRRRLLFETFPKLKLGLAFGQNMSILNELIGYVNLTDCRKISQNIQRMMMNKTASGNFDI